jgi:Leucine rich repeat/Leucine Rich Repeat
MKMKKEDLDKWLNEDFNEPENDRFEKDMMGNLYEFRKTQELKKRLQKQRQQRRIFKWGLWSVLGLAALSFVGYKFVFSAKEKDINSALTEQQIQESNKELGIARDTQQAQLNAQKILEKEKTRNLRSGENVPFLPPKQPNIDPNLTKNDRIKIELPRKPIFSSPSDTEYIYTHTDRDPFLYRSFPTEKADDLTPQDTVLDLSKRKYMDVPPSVFLYKKLKKLSISRNDIESIPNDIGQLNALETLDLSSNRLMNLPIKLSDLTALKRLNLRKNKFKNVPIVVIEMTQLTHLDLSSNRLKTLPNEIEKLTQLKVLDVSFNNLSTLPDALINLKELEELNLRGNMINTIPDTLYQMKQLKKLNLKGNKFMYLPEQLEQLTGLVELDLSDNPLEELPDTIEKLTKLRKLILRNTTVTIDDVRELQKLLPDCLIQW